MTSTAMSIASLLSCHQRTAFILQCMSSRIVPMATSVPARTSTLSFAFKRVAVSTDSV